MNEKENEIMRQQGIDTLAAQQAPGSVVLADVDTAELTPGIINGTFFLTVCGTKPWLTMKVLFVPLLYVQQPDYTTGSFH